MDTEIAKGMRGKESGVVYLDALIGEIGRRRKERRGWDEN
jgi:hypothetical protein